MTRTLTIAVAGLAAIAAGAAIAGAQQPGPAPAGTSLELTARPSGGSALDLGRKGTSVGDEFFERGRLADAAGHVAGRFQLVTQLVDGDARRGTEQNAFTLMLSGGQIAVAGAHATTGRFTMPVVGGTGAYTGARGTLSVAPGPRGAERLTLKLEG